MTEEPEGELVKIRAEVVDGGWMKHESFWAEALGDNLYRVGNILWFVYDTHLHDVVEAVAQQPGEIPTVTKVVRRSGRKTLRVMFDQALPAEEAVGILDELQQIGVTYERGRKRGFYAMDVPAETDYQAVCNRLWQLKHQGRLDFETGSTSSDALDEAGRQ